MTSGGLRVIVLSYKAMNGLRRAPLRWFLELQKTVYEVGGQDTFESTLFRISTSKGFILILVYVEDLLVASHDEKEGADFPQKLTGIFGKPGSRERSQHSRRVLFSSWGDWGKGPSLNFKVSEAYMVGIIYSWHEKLKPSEAPPKVEEIFKGKEKHRRVKQVTTGFLVSWQGLLCPQLICVLQFHILRGFSQSQLVPQKRVCVHCCVSC